MNESAPLVLEIFKQDDKLSMSIFEQRESAVTLKHYSQTVFCESVVQRISRDVAFVIQRAACKRTAGADATAELKRTGRLLWDQLLTRHIKDKLRQVSAPRDLVISIDEELTNIPWELLNDGSDFLCLRHNVGRIVRTREYSPAPAYRSIAKPLKMLVLANPTNDLKSAYFEGLNIKNQFDRKRSAVRIDFKSTNIDTFYIKKNLREYDLVHFAGHCEYDPLRPQETGWVLSDGRFSTADILTLGESAALPMLVFSNACHSAEICNDAQDVDYQHKTYSLAAAFLFSGVRLYIGAIWKIEDPISFAFAKEFYSQLLKGSRVGECMRYGRNRLLQEYGTRSIHWANYIFYGDPTCNPFGVTRPYKPAGPRRIRLKRKQIIPLALTMVLAVGIWALAVWLPARNPTSYMFLVRAQRDFKTGNNNSVLDNAGKVLARDPGLLAVYPLLADTYQRLGKKEEALKYYFEYALQSEQRGAYKDLAQAYIGIGWLYHLSGDYPQAREFYEKSITISKGNIDVYNEAVAMRKLAVWYMDKEQDDKALELLMRSAEINRDHQRTRAYRYNLARDYFNLGLVFTNKEDFAAAKNFYAKSQQIFESLRLIHELSDVYFNIGEINFLEKAYQKALLFYAKGLEIDRDLGNVYNLASDYNMFGELYCAIGKLDQAEEYYQKALKLARDIDAQPEQASIYFNLGRLYKLRKKYSQAREYFRSAQEIYRRIDTPTFDKVKEELLSLSR